MTTDTLVGSIKIQGLDQKSKKVDLINKGWE